MRHQSTSIAGRMTLIICLLLLTALIATPSGGPLASPPADTTGSSSIHGVVKFEGTVPKPGRINMDAEPVCAKVHPGGMLSQDYVVSANGALANVIVYISDGLGGRTFEPPAQEATLEQKGCVYKPHVLAVQAGQKIKVINGDQTTHNIHPSPQNNREWNKSQPPGMEPVEGVFAREEISIPVKCNVHPWMKMYVAVIKHPYFSTTSADGAFDISGLPPGEYTIQAWHEKLGTSTQRITVGQGEKKQVSFVYRAKP